MAFADCADRLAEGSFAHLAANCSTSLKHTSTYKDSNQEIEGALRERAECSGLRTANRLG